MTAPAIFTVTFLGNGSTGGSMAAEQESAPTPLTTNTLTRTGYTFTGWNTAADGSGIAYAGWRDLLLRRRRHAVCPVGDYRPADDHRHRPDVGFDRRWHERDDHRDGSNGATVVDFGTTAAVTVNVVNATTISATSPAARPAWST